jgi:hypothetical protein
LNTNFTHSDRFYYHPLLNTAYLEKLYGDDYESAELVFSGFCDESDSYTTGLAACFARNDKEGMMDHLHKISASYGYLGLPQFSQRMKDFIAQCKDAERLELILVDYENLFHDMVAYHKIINNVLKQLKSYAMAQAS